MTDNVGIKTTKFLLLTLLKRAQPNWRTKNIFLYLFFPSLLTSLIFTVVVWIFSCKTVILPLYCNYYINKLLVSITIHKNKNQNRNTTTELTNNRSERSKIARARRTTNPFLIQVKCGVAGRARIYRDAVLFRFEMVRIFCITLNINCMRFSPTSSTTVTLIVSVECAHDYKNKTKKIENNSNRYLYWCRLAKRWTLNTGLNNVIEFGD